MPEAPPVIPGYDIAVLSDFCFDVAADYYDFINLGPQSLLLVSAEVEGHGVSSALIMANLQATLRALPDASVDVITTDPGYSGMNRHMKFGHGRIVGQYSKPGNDRCDLGADAQPT